MKRPEQAARAAQVHTLCKAFEASPADKAQRRALQAALLALAQDRYDDARPLVRSLFNRSLTLGDAVQHGFRA